MGTDASVRYPYSRSCRSVGITVLKHPESAGARIKSAEEFRLSALFLLPRYLFESETVQLLKKLLFEKKRTLYGKITA